MHVSIEAHRIGLQRNFNPVSPLRTGKSSIHRSRAGNLHLFMDIPEESPELAKKRCMNFIPSNPE
jgi:hypothetical protein